LKAYGTSRRLNSHLNKAPSQYTGEEETGRIGSLKELVKLLVASSGLCSRVKVILGRGSFVLEVAVRGFVEGVGLVVGLHAGELEVERVFVGAVFSLAVVAELAGDLGERAVPRGARRSSLRRSCTSGTTDSSLGGARTRTLGSCSWGSTCTSFSGVTRVYLIRLREQLVESRLALGLFFWGFFYLLFEVFGFPRVARILWSLVRVRLALLVPVELLLGLFRLASVVLSRFSVHFYPVEDALLLFVDSWFLFWRSLREVWLLLVGVRGWLSLGGF
jgi:hypothetical protein